MIVNVCTIVLQYADDKKTFFWELFTKKMCVNPHL